MPQLKQYIDRIENNELLVPEFQRGYVWKVDQQKSLIASVLSGLPLGGLLVVEGRTNDFLATKLGTHIVVEESELQGNLAKYLVDGQQRLTTLVNIFSNKIHEFAKYDVERLKGGDRLKYRWFLRIPRPQTDAAQNHDVFSVRGLDFDRNQYITTADLIDYIHPVIMNARGHRHVDPEPYSNELEGNAAEAYSNDWSTIDQDYYLIPLYLFCDKNKRMILERELFGRYLPAEITKDLKKAGIINTEDKETEFRRNATPYWMDIYYFIQDKIDNMYITEVNFSASERERAIEAYECMNRGGVSLSVFDLLIAKASLVDRNFLNNFINYIENETPDRLNTLFGFHTTGAQRFIDDASKNKDFVNSFRNLLGLYIGSNGGTVNLRWTKEDFILNDITPEQIINNYEKIIDAMESAAEFLMDNLGITTWRDVKYKLMFNVVAYYYLVSDEVNLNKISAWWWSAIFSAEFSRLQNARMIDGMNRIIGDNGDFWDNILSRIEGEAPQSLFDGDVVGEIAFTNNPKARLKQLVSQYINATNSDIENIDIENIVYNICSDTGFYHFKEDVLNYLRGLAEN